MTHRKFFPDRHLILNLIAAGFLCWSNLGHAQDSSGAPDSERIRKLEEVVAQMQRENRELRQEVQALKPALPASVAAGKAADSAAGDRPRFVLPAGKESTLKLGGFIQGNVESGDVSSFEGRLAGGANAVNNRFRLRRARLNVTGDFAEHFDFKLEGDFQQADGIAGGRTGFSSTDLFLNWNRWPAANVKIGQFKAPFGLEQLTSDTILLTPERTLVTGALTPERQIGVQLWGKPLSSERPAQRDLFSYALGVFNGNGRNTTANDNNDFMLAARLESTVLAGKIFEQSAKVKLGVNGLYSRDAANVNLSTTLALALQPDGSLLPFSTHTPDKRHAVGADLSVTWGPLDLIAEFLEERIRPTTAAANFRAFLANGGYVQAGWFILPDRLQLVGKWDTFNPGQERNDDFQSTTAGLNYYLKGHDLKLMFNYIHTRSDFRRTNPRLGQDRFDQLLGRIQVIF